MPVALLNAVQPTAYNYGMQRMISGKSHGLLAYDAAKKCGAEKCGANNVQVLR